MYKADICWKCQTHFNVWGTAFSSILNDAPLLIMSIAQCEYGLITKTICESHVAIYIVRFMSSKCQMTCK